MTSRNGISAQRNASYHCRRALSFASFFLPRPNTRCQNPRFFCGSSSTLVGGGGGGGAAVSAITTGGVRGVSMCTAVGLSPGVKTAAIDPTNPRVACKLQYDVGAVPR